MMDEIVSRLLDAPIGARCEHGSLQRACVHCDAVEDAARIAALEAALQAGRDVMAVIHGDGGHYREAHGDRKAADDAINIVYKLRADLAIERNRREAAEWVLKEIRIRLHAAGRRPEECWEMSEIDGHFAHFACKGER